MQARATVGTAATRHSVELARAIDECYDRGWTDGLPVVPPTVELVEAMLGADDGAFEVGTVPPLGGSATLEKIAVNAVMAGCVPEYFPVVRAAVEAVLQPDFNLAGLQATTHVSTPMIIVSGPVVGRIGLNASFGVFGSGCRANSTIGRALALVLWNLGGARPGVGDMSTFGLPTKHGSCIAERQEISPWEPHHVQRGYAPDDSVVTVFAGEAPKSIVGSRYDRGILMTAADTMATLGAANLHLMGPMLFVVGAEHAAALGEAGWTREAVQEFLFENARRRAGDLRAQRTYNEDVRRRYWPDYDNIDDDSLIPVVERPEDILVIVSGGDVGRFSLCCPAWGKGGRACSVRVGERSE